MMDIVLGGAMGLVLAVLLSSPPREKVRPVTAEVVGAKVGTKPGAKRAKKK